MALYDYDVDNIRGNNTPFRYRYFPKLTAWMLSLLQPLQWDRDNFFNTYVNGSTDSQWLNLNTYNYGDRVVLFSYFVGDNGVYRSIRNNNTNHVPWSSPDWWEKISDDYRGVRERIKYNGQKLMLEYVLNHFFGTVFRQPDSDGSSVAPTDSDIFISQNILINNIFLIADNGQGYSICDDNTGAFFRQWIADDSSTINYYARTINVPDSGGSPNPGWWTAFNSDGNGEQKIQAIVDRYNIAGVLYNIVPY